MFSFGSFSFGSFGCCIVSNVYFLFCSICVISAGISECCECILVIIRDIICRTLRVCRRQKDKVHSHNGDEGFQIVSRTATSALGIKGAEPRRRMPIAPRGPPPVTTQPYHHLHRRPSLVHKCPSII